MNDQTGLISRASSSASMSFICRFCSKSFSSTESLAQHESRHFFRPFSANSHRTRRNFHVRVSRKKFRCSKCDSMFFTVSARTSHQKRHNFRSGHGPTVEDWGPAKLRWKYRTQRDAYSTCQLCGKVFGYRPCLSVHMRSHGFTAYSLVKVCWFPATCWPLV